MPLLDKTDSTSTNLLVIASKRAYRKVRPLFNRHPDAIERLFEIQMALQQENPILNLGPDKKDEVLEAMMNDEVNTEFADALKQGIMTELNAIMAYRDQLRDQIASKMLKTLQAEYPAFECITPWELFLASGEIVSETQKGNNV